MLVSRIASLRYPSTEPLQWKLLPDTIIFLFGPLIFLFIRRLLFNHKAPRYLLHFFPLGIYLLSVIYFFTFGQAHFYELYQNRKIWVYLILSYRLLHRYSVKKKNQISFNQRSLTFLKLFLFCFLICSLLWIASYIMTNFYQTRAYINYLDVWLSLPILTYLVGYYMMAKPEIFRLPYIIQEKPSPDNQRLKPHEIEKLQKALDHQMEEHKVFNKNDLTLKELANLLGTSGNNLSWLLNEIYNKSFYDFINSQRIAAFVKKIEENEHKNKTILALAEEVGFNSKSTFNKAFKAVLNETPSAYIRKVS